MKKLIYYSLVITILFFYFFANYKFEKIKQFDNILDISFLDDNPNEQLLKSYLEQNENVTDIIGLNADGFVDVLEKDYDRSKEAKLLKIFGNPQKIFPKEDILYKSYFEKNGAYISNSLAYSLFKNNNVIGNKIFINNIEYIVCGVFKDEMSTIIVRNDKEDKFNNIKVFFDKSNNIVMNMSSFIRLNNSENIYINNINSKVNTLYFLLQLPKFLMLILTTVIFFKVLNFKNKFNIKNTIYQILAIIMIILFYLVLNINLKIPINFIPNKWSDFDFYKNLFTRFYSNFKNYIQIDKSLIFINIDKNLYTIIALIIINIFLLSLMYFIFKLNIKPINNKY